MRILILATLLPLFLTSCVEPSKNTSVSSKTDKSITKEEPKPFHTVQCYSGGVLVLETESYSYVSALNDGISFKGKDNKKYKAIADCIVSDI